MSSVVTALTCGACGRRFAWRPEYAGKTLKCKCGQPIKAPAAVPAAGSGAAKPKVPTTKQPAVATTAAVSSGGGNDVADLFGSAQATYEMAPPLTPPSQSAPQKPRTIDAPAPGPRRTSSPLAYAGMLRKQPVDQEAGNGLAVTSLVLGIVSCAMFWFCTPWLPRGLGVLAIIFGLRAIAQGAGGKAKAGLILGIVGIVATFLFWIVVSNAADRIGKAIEKNAEQWQKQAEQAQKQAEEAQRKAQEQTQHQSPNTQPAGVSHRGTRQNP